MAFLNIWFLLGAFAVAVPILIHILNHQSAKRVEWAAMRFLLASLVSRRRRLLLEELLLLAVRCLLLMLLVLALARPFVAPGSRVAWFVVLPLTLAAVTGFGATFALWRYPVWRRRLFVAASALLVLAISAMLLQEWLHFRMFGSRDRRDVVLVIDTSDSMLLETDGVQNLELALREAEHIIRSAPPDTAFSLIVGGSVPYALVGAPTGDRTLLLEQVRSIPPSGGVLRGLDSLALAALLLSYGNHPTKQIVFISDGQRAGWEVDESMRWQRIREGFARLPTVPPVFFRRLPMPETIRNVAVSDIQFTRATIGSDRAVGIDVTVFNRGTEAVTPDALQLTVGDALYSDSAVGQLAPGAAKTIGFVHRFQAGQAWPVEAEILVEDDLGVDNRLSRVIAPEKALQILIVDGAPSRRFMERAAAYAALAMAPDAATRQPSPARALQPPEDSRFLLVPHIVDLPAVGQVDDLAPYAVVLLADVARLPAAFAARLGQYVADGGALLVAPGPRAEPEFYAGWQHAGAPVLPALLRELRVMPPSSDDGQSGLTPMPQSFSHAALEAFRDQSSAFEQVVFRTSWDIAVRDEAVRASIGARFGDRGIMLVEHPVGKGRVLQLAFSLDARAGNFVGNRNFVPFLHELLDDLSARNAISLNLDYAPGAMLTMPMQAIRRRHAGRTGLLRTLRTAGRGVDDVSIFAPGNVQVNLEHSPAPGFAENPYQVFWDGILKVPFSGTYGFELREVAPRGDIFIDGTRVGQGGIELQGGTEYALQVVLHKASGARGHIHVQVKPPGGELGNLPDAWVRPFPSAALLAERYPQLELLHDTHALAPLRVRAQEDTLQFTLPPGMRSGLVAAKVPSALALLFEGMLDVDGHLPLALFTKGARAPMAPLSSSDVRQIQERVAWQEATSSEQLLSALSGEKFGQELWRPLAVFALLLLLAEVLLTRWIAIQRKTGMALDVAFQQRMQPAAAFTEQLKAMRNDGS